MRLNEPVPLNWAVGLIVYESLGANDHRGMVNLNLRDMVGRVNTEDH